MVVVGTLVMAVVRTMVVQWYSGESGVDSGDSETMVGTQRSGTAVGTVGTLAQWWGQWRQWDSGGDSWDTGESGI
eukprot:2291869-Pyramimonas_sp.AAC.1